MRIYLVSLVLCCYSLIPSNLGAQQLPNTNLYLFDLNQLSDSIIEFSNPKYLTYFNEYGYNNQPYFLANDAIMFTAQFPEDTSQTDIFLLNLTDKTKTQITATPESEYSPTFIPKGRSTESLQFSAVRVEMDGTQRLWRFPMDLSDNGRPALTQITDIGYHYWINPSDLLLFIVDEPHRLIISNTETEKTVNVASQIGRCFQKMPRGNVAYVHMINDKTWLLKELDTETYRTRLITATLQGSEDFITLSDGTIIMGKGSKLYKFNKLKDIAWLEIADFSDFGIYDITRMALNFNQNKIVLVNRQE